LNSDRAPQLQASVRRLSLTSRGKLFVKTMHIRLRGTSERDLDFVLSAEQSAENRSFVTVWTREQHLGALTSEDLSHLIIESTADRSRVGYIILAGLADANQSIEFRRIVVTEKGKGYGKEALRLVKKLAFEELKAHRLWLDVKEHNVRARHLYESEGFVAEGVLRECIKADVGFESLVVMSMLSGEYHDAQQQ
jgi:RimJ/RimL family protein N-acetyltransferase